MNHGSGAPVRLIRWFLFGLATILVTGFAIANRHGVVVWPHSEDATVPLAIVIVVTLVLGFVAGELAAWIGGRRWRREARHKERRIAVLERELAATQAQLRPEPPLPEPLRGAVKP
jgi:uncharacterized integral membrane protein